MIDVNGTKPGRVVYRRETYRMSNINNYGTYLRQYPGTVLED